jgi:glycolate oxidase FAD binding subunit
MTDEPAGSVLTPRDAADLAEIVAGHATALEPIGLGSKRSIGNVVLADPLDLAALTGVLSYDPGELVLTAAAATPLGDIEVMLNAEHQRLGFEPPDLGPLLGDARPQSIGGVLAANLSGSRRITGGSARDHFLGFEAVSGRGERFRAGGKVVKNVTGYDLPKLMAGSWGTLAVLSEVTLRIVPRAETETTLILDDRSPEAATATMTAALGSPFDISAAAFDPWRGTALRLEGFEASVRSRAAALLAALSQAPAERLDGEVSAAFWQTAGGAAALADWPVVWRISVPPGDAPGVLASLEPERYLLDWGGGLIWAAYASVDSARVRGALREGHATLIKAPESARTRTCVLHPPRASLAAVHHRIKAAFDPDGKLNPGRMD